MAIQSATLRTGAIHQNGPLYRDQAQGVRSVQYRISKGTGRAMVAFAFFLDLLPFILVVVALVATFGGLVPVEATNASLWQKLKAFVESVATMAGAAFLAAAGILILAPAAYFIGSFLAPILGFLIFLLWFLMKGVNPFSITGALLMLLETIPLVNLLPTITLVVWRRIRASRKEDELHQGGEISISR